MQPVGSGPDARRYSVLATKAHRSALYSALMKDFYRRPATWWRPVVIGMLGVALLVGGPVPGGAAAVVGVGAAVVLFFVGLRRYEHSVSALLDRGWFEGSEHESAFDADGMVFRGPVGAVEYRWDTVAGVLPEPRVVAVHLRPGKVRQYIPVELFPVEEVTAVRRHLG